MIESGRVSSDLPELDRSDDPRGGAVAWALLAAGMVPMAAALWVAMWLAGAW